MMREKTMRAAVLASPGRFELARMPVPRPGPGQVLVRVEGCGLCGSNLPVFEGRPWFEYPRKAGEPGHEAWGEVVETGPGVDGLIAGARVAMLSYHGFAEYDLAESESVVPLPPPLEKKPVPGEALGCAMNVFHRSEISAGQKVVVIGVGFLGALLVQLAAGAGASVLALSRRPFALEIARLMGASQVLPLAHRDQAIERVREWTSGAGADRVIEAVGTQGPLDLASELVRERGRLIIAGYHQDGPRQVNMQLWNWRGIDVINAHERDPKVYVSGIREAVEALAHNELDPRPLCTHAFSLDQINHAFQTALERPDGFLKAIVTP